MTKFPGRTANGTTCIDRGGHCKCQSHGSTKCPHCTCAGAAKQPPKAEKE